MEHDGSVGLLKPRVEEDEEGRITGIIAKSEQQARDIAAARGVKLNEESRRPVPLADDERRIWLEVDAQLSWRTDVTALKSAMLSFDEKLAEQPSRRFTRHPSLAGVREFVRAAIMDDDTLDHGAYARHVMGLQYDKMPEIETVRCQHGPPERSEFEHVLVASGNTAERRLDVVWWIGGIDPFGFRLSQDWREYGFTCLLVSGMLKGQSCSDPIWVEHAHSVSGPSRNCVIPTEDAGALAQLEALCGRRQERICSAHQSATLLVEMRSDEHVAEQLARRAKTMRGLCGGLRADAVLAGRLQDLYADRLADPTRRDRFEAAVASRLPTHHLRVGASAPVADLTRPDAWLPLLPVYRQALKEVAAVLGLPGHLRARGQSITTEPRDGGTSRHSAP